MSGSDSVMLMRMDGRATPLSRFQSDIPKLKRIVQEIEATDTPAHLQSALSSAADALRARQKPHIILVGDGAYDERELGSVVWSSPELGEDKASFEERRLSTVDLSGIDVSYAPIGRATDNVGIVGFNVRRYISNKLNYEVYIEIQNFSEEPASRRLVLYNGSTEIDVQQIQLKPGEKSSRIYKDLGGGDEGVLRATIESIDEGKPDVFPLDDEAWALIPENKRQEVLLVSEDNLYLKKALLVFDHLDGVIVTPREYERLMAAHELEAYDVAIFHDYTPEVLPPSETNLLYFRPSGEHSPFPVGKELERGRVTSVSKTHPVMRWIDMHDVNFDSLQTFRVDSSKAEVPLALSIRSPIAAAKKDGRRKIAAFGFGLDGTDIMLRVAFPLLMVNTMDWFAGGDSDLITTYTAGKRARVRLDGTYGISEVEVLTPSGKQRKAPLSEGYATFFASEVGVHTLTARKDGLDVATIVLASNLSNVSESDIQPSTELLLGGQSLKAPVAGTPSYQQSIWLYLTLMVLLLLLVEWYTFNRRITV
jgi:hypothetical protein